MTADTHAHQWATAEEAELKLRRNSGFQANEAFLARVPSPVMGRGPECMHTDALHFPTTLHRTCNSGCTAQGTFRPHKEQRGGLRA